MTHHDPSGVPPCGQSGGPVPGQPPAPGRPVPQYGAYGTAPVPAYGRAAPPHSGASGQMPPSAPVHGQPMPPVFGAYGGGYGSVRDRPSPGASRRPRSRSRSQSPPCRRWPGSRRSARPRSSSARARRHPERRGPHRVRRRRPAAPSVQLAAAVVTCLWLWQSRVLAEAVSPGRGHARSRVWVWLGWIVPVVAFWFPYQVVRDVRAATVVVRDAASDGGGPGGCCGASPRTSPPS